MSMKKIAVALVAALLVLCGAQVACADDFYGNYPNPVDAANPAAGPLVAARAGLDQSIQNFWAAYYGSPYDYWRVVNAYYGYVNAYYAYRYRLDAYWKQENATRTFAGTVRTRDALPGQAIPMIYPWSGFSVSGAQVQLASASQIVGTRTSGDDGSFSFPGLASGVYTYTITAPGFGTTSGTVDLSNGSSTQTLYLSRQRTLTGTVVTPVRMGAYINPPPPPQPVAGAQVTLTYRAVSGVQNWASLARQTTTDANGRFSFDAIPTDVAVNLTITAPNYQTDTESYSLSQLNTDVRITLNSTLPPPPIAVPLTNAAQPAATTGSDVENAFGR